MYGANCNNPCGKCFDLEQCHHISGTCLTGCESGYRGLKCTEGWTVYLVHDIQIWNKYDTALINSFFLECMDTFFGINCSQECDNKCNSCNRTTGTCDNGCKPGWTGVSCQTGTCKLYWKLECHHIKMILRFEYLNFLHC